MRRDGERELVARKQYAGTFLLREQEVLFELRQRGDPIFQLPFPVIPEFRWRVRPITRRMRNELFPVLFPFGKSEHFDLGSKVKRARFCVNEGTWWCVEAVGERGFIPGSAQFARFLLSAIIEQRLPCFCPNRRLCTA